MKKLVLAALAALFALAAAPALAANCSTLPFSLVNGTTADASQVMADLNLILNCANNNLAHNGANSDITSLSGLLTPLSTAQGGTGQSTSIFSSNNTWAGTQAINGVVTYGATITLFGGTTLIPTMTLTSGALLTAPAAGVVEWNGTNLFVTQTAGPTRKTVGYADLSNLTGTVPIANGGTNAASAGAALTNLGAAPIASPTFTGKVTTAATALAGAGLNLPHGTAPTSPVNGDIWTTTGGVFAQVNGGTLGPLGAFSALEAKGATQQTFGAGFNLVTLSTTPYNTISGASLATNQVTLPAGVYYVNAVVGQVVGNAGGQTQAQCAWKNATDSTYPVVGQTIDVLPSGRGSFFVNGYFTLAAQKTMELRCYAGAWPPSIGTFATSSGLGDVFVDVVIQKIG